MLIQVNIYVLCTHLLRYPSDDPSDDPSDESRVIIPELYGSF